MHYSSVATTEYFFMDTVNLCTPGCLLCTQFICCYHRTGFMMLERLFLAVPRGCLRFVIVVFPDHTHLLFFMIHHCSICARACILCTPFIFCCPECFLCIAVLCCCLWRHASVLLPQMLFMYNIVLLLPLIACFCTPFVFCYHRMFFMHTIFCCRISMSASQVK